MPPAANDMVVKVPPGIRILKVAGGMDKVEDGGDGGYGLYAGANFTKGDDVYEYPSEPWPRDRSDPGKIADTVDLLLSGPSLPPEGLIVRITPLEHGELYADGTVEISGFDMICNHCCDANMYYDEERSTAVAARDIKVGEELTVNYNCHNWDETSNLLTFDCASFCKTPLCCRSLKGFKYLSPERQQELVEQGGCSEYVLEQWKKAKAKALKKATTRKQAPKKTYDYSGLEKGTKCQAESDGKFYAAEVVAVSTAKSRIKAPVKVTYKGYDGYDEWMGGDRLRSKALKVTVERPEPKERRPRERPVLHYFPFAPRFRGVPPKARGIDMMWGANLEDMLLEAAKTGVFGALFGGDAAALKRDELRAALEKWFGVFENLAPEEGFVTGGKSPSPADCVAVLLCSGTAFPWSKFGPLCDFDRDQYPKLKGVAERAAGAKGLKEYLESSESIRADPTSKQDA